MNTSTMNIRTYPIIFILSLWSITSFSQSVLESYVEEGLKNNQQYLKERLDINISKEEKAISNSLFLPNVTFNAGYLLADGGRTIDIPIGDLFNPVYSTLNQLTDSNQFPTDLANVNEQFLPNDFHETKIRVTQPILNTDIYYGHKAGHSLLSVSEAKESAYKNQLSFQIRKAYYDHLKLLEQKAILDSTRLVLKELVRVNGKYVKYDVATKDVLYNAEAQFYGIDARLATVEKNINTSRNFFNFLLNRDLASQIIVDATLPLEREEFSEDLLKENALQNRSELEQVRKGIEANDYEIKRNKGYLIPDISAGAEFGYQGFGYTFDQDQDYYLISFNLSWPIFQGGKNKAQVRKARFEKQKLEADYTDIKNQIQLDASNGLYSYQEALAVYKAKRSQLKSATESYKIIEGKYRQSKVLLVEYNEARTQLTTAQLNESIARFNIKIAKANLIRITQNNL